MMTTIHWVVIVISGAFSAAEIWAQRFMFRRPIPGMLIRYVLGFAFAAFWGAIGVLSNLSVNTAILVTALTTGLLWGHVFFDSMMLFDFYHETGTAEATE